MSVERMCGICRHPMPGHEPGCPVETGEPQRGVLNMIQQTDIPFQDPGNVHAVSTAVTTEQLIAAYQEVIVSKNDVIAVQQDLIEALRLAVSTLEAEVIKAKVAP